MVKVRFAPSPTGHLHVGGARTALFNWLFARKNDGKFVLRIEDTDVERSSKEMSFEILNALNWLKLDWDEGPVYQSRRLRIYQRMAERLIKEGKAYYCYCTREDIEERKKRAEEQGKSWKYDRRCLNLKEDEIERFKKEGRPRAVRFIIPEGKTEFHDLVLGDISVDNEEIEDFVLLKSDGYPTYHLSVVVDDHLLGITHVIRGADHIANTPKQILLYKAFGWNPPLFAHLPLILGPDRKKLSKRHGETSLLAFRDRGYLSLAMFNFLAQLSWSPGEDKEFYEINELVERFDLNKVRHSNPVFDFEKLSWLNARMISRLPVERIWDELVPFLQKEGILEDLEKNMDWAIKMLSIVKERTRNLVELASTARRYVRRDFNYNEDAIKKYWKDGVKEGLKRLKSVFEKLEVFDASTTEKALRELAEELGLKAARLIHPLRIALLGERVSPGIFDVLEILGKEETLARMERALKELPDV